MAVDIAAEPRVITSLANYYQLGRSGLRVSPLCLGTMTFGTEWGWGSTQETANAILDRFTEAGGNFIDTADGYTNGTSERFVGQWIKDKQNRAQVVLATKFFFPHRQGDPNAFGNSRKHIYDAIHASLDRLQTDYLDLYWLHAWDTLTPGDEVLRTIDDLVSSGKVRYFGLSDIPAWYAAHMATLAQWRGWSPPVAMQLEYSLASRTIEFEYIDLAHQFGMGITPWSPLAFGMLTGKYRRENGEVAGEGRLATMKASGDRRDERFTDRNFAIVEELVAVAQEVGKSPAQVALNWITRRPGINSTIIGASKLEQLNENIEALEFTLSAELSARLDTATAPTPHFPYTFFTPVMRERFIGQQHVALEPPWFRK